MLRFRSEVDAIEDIKIITNREQLTQEIVAEGKKYSYVGEGFNGGVKEMFYLDNDTMRSLRIKFDDSVGFSIKEVYFKA